MSCERSERYGWCQIFWTVPSCLRNVHVTGEITRNKKQNRSAARPREVKFVWSLCFGCPEWLSSSAADRGTMFPFEYRHTFVAGYWNLLRNRRRMWEEKLSLCVCAQERKRVCEPLSWQINTHRKCLRAMQRKHYLCALSLIIKVQDSWDCLARTLFQ